MAVLITVKFTGDPEQLFAICGQRQELMMGVPRPGIISFALCRVDDGILMVEQWESAEAARESLKHPNNAKANELYPMPQPVVKVAEVLVSVAGNAH